MLNIEEWKLKDLLFRRKKHIKSNSSLIENILCLLGFVVSILLSNIISAPLYVKIGVGIIGIIYLIAFVFNVYGSNYSVDAFYKDICSVAEKNHNFSLLMLKDNSGLFPASYILNYEKRWKCFLFPFIRTNINDDKKSVENYLKEVFLIDDFEIEKIKEQDLTKYSVSANFEKTYHHTFYLISFNATKSKLNKRSFYLNRQKYKWFTISEMKQNKRIKDFNSETVNFVENNF